MLRALLATVIGFVALSAWAAPGDKLYVAGNNVNVRSGPSTGNPMIVQLNKGHELFEFGRQGDWVNVGISRSGGKDGWIHSTLVTTAYPGGSTKAPIDPRFSQFKEAIETLNARAKDVAGIDFFTKVENLGDGIVQLTATEAWLSAPYSDRRGNLDTVFSLWDAADGTGLPIEVRVVDRSGILEMKKSRR